MIETIKWSAHTPSATSHENGIADVDGVMVIRQSAKYRQGAARVWAAAPAHVEVYCDDDEQSVDLAARAVVAAVKVLRGEADAAVAAERERCAAWVWQASAAADENVIGDEDVAAWAIERIKSGAPAPKE